MTTETNSKLYFELAHAFARAHGQPIPKELLEIGGDANGLRVKLNNTGEDRENFPRAAMLVSYGEMTVGIITVFGGCLMSDEDHTEQDLIEWAQNYQPERAESEVR